MPCFLLLNVIILRFIHGMAHINSALTFYYCIVNYWKYIWGCLFTELLMETLDISVLTTKDVWIFWLLWMSLYGHMLSFIEGKYDNYMYINWLGHIKHMFKSLRTCQMVLYHCTFAPVVFYFLCILASFWYDHSFNFSPL